MNALQVYAGSFDCTALCLRHHRLRFHRLGPPQMKPLLTFPEFKDVCFVQTKTKLFVFKHLLWQHSLSKKTTVQNQSFNIRYVISSHHTIHQKMSCILLHLFVFLFLYREDFEPGCLAKFEPGTSWFMASVLTPKPQWCPADAVFYRFHSFQQIPKISLHATVISFGG